VLAFGACGKKEEAQPQAEPAAAQELLKVVPGEMVLIPAGEYVIGSNEKDPTTKDVTLAYPEHKVKLPPSGLTIRSDDEEYLDFSINTSYSPEGESEGKTWRTFFSPDRAMQPVVYVTWKDADAYCKAGRQETSHGRRVGSRGEGARRIALSVGKRI